MSLCNPNLNHRLRNFQPWIQLKMKTTVEDTRPSKQRRSPHHKWMCNHHPHIKRKCVIIAFLFVIFVVSCIGRSLRRFILLNQELSPTLSSLQTITEILYKCSEEIHITARKYIHVYKNLTYELHAPKNFIFPLPFSG